jgi:VanZ family protein
VSAANGARRATAIPARSGRADRLVLAVAVVVHLVVLYAPRAPSTASTPGLDKLVHAAVFGAVAWAAVRCGVRRPVVGGVLAAHAVVSEVLQHFVLPHRSGDPLDAVADVVGVGLGLLAAARVRRASDARSREAGADAGSPGGTPNGTPGGRATDEEAHRA